MVLGLAPAGPRHPSAASPNLADPQNLGVSWEGRRGRRRHGACEMGGVHPISFQFKRAHLSAVAMGRRLFRGTKEPSEFDFDGVRDMTPARFDILHVIHRRFYECGRQVQPFVISMRELRRQLGLSPSTLSQAVNRLIQLGLLTKEVIQNNRRAKRVVLTREGLARIRQAYHLVFTGRTISRHYRAFIRDSFTKVMGKKRLAARINTGLNTLWDTLLSLGHHVGNSSQVVYRFRHSVDDD